MKPTVKTDVLKRARGLSLGPPVSVTRDDDSRATRRLSPKELNRLVEKIPEQPLSFRMWLVMCVAGAFVIGLLLGRSRTPVSALPPPVRYVARPVRLEAPETVLAPVRRLLLPRSARPKKPPPGITEPLFRDSR